MIGSGPNGLAAAITLAQVGAEVLVLEAAAVAGGAVATEALTLPGFRHDTYSSVYPAAAASPVFAAMPLERHGLRWVHPVACYAHPLEDGRGAALYRDLDRTAQSLDALAPGDGGAWQRFVSPWLEHFELLRDTLLGQFAPVRSAARLAVGLRPRRLAELSRVALMPVQALAGELFTDPGARAWLYGSAMHGDVAPGSSAARSPPCFSISSATPPAGRAQRAAPAGSPVPSSGTWRASVASSAPTPRSYGSSPTAGVRAG